MQERVEPTLPPVRPPKGMEFLFKTWSGRIILVNALVFIALSWDSGSITMPSEEALRFWGAKDNVLIAQGEYWRFITPMFVHIGIIHFAFNNWALYVLGYQLEFLLKPRWFIILYFLAGIGGNIASSIQSLGLSAGASGALFGLLGAGFYLERRVGSRLAEMGATRPRSNIYTGMVLLNIALGFVIPMIDNAAHLGGLFVGVVFTHALLNLRPNRLLPVNRLKGRLTLAFLAGLFITGLGLSCSSQRVYMRFKDALVEAEDPRLQYRFQTEILRLRPDDVDVRMQRLRLALLVGDWTAAEVDYLKMQDYDPSQSRLKQLLSELQALGDRPSVMWLQQRLQEPTL